MHTTPDGRAIAWFLLVALGVANVAGYAFDLYQRFWWFDRVLHGGTMFAATLWLAVFVFGSVVEGGRGRGFLAVLLFASVGIALGALWEVAEWDFDQVAFGDVIKGKHDTIIDIVMDTAGALLAGILALRLARRPTRTPAGSR